MAATENSTQVAHRTAIVTDCERGSALAVVRSLGRAGWRVIAVSDTANALAFRSRYTATSLVAPSPMADPAGFVTALESCAAEHQADLVIPVTENTLLPLAAARGRFEPATTLAIAEDATLAVALDKHATVTLAGELSIPVPLTRFVESVEDARAALVNASWPVVIKPQRSLPSWAGAEDFEACKISYANSLAQVEERLMEAAGRYGFLLQEYCGGRGCGIELLVDSGRVLAAFQHLRLAEVPTTGGASAMRTSVPLDPQLFAYAAKLVASLNWTGLCMIEFRGEGDAARLMEMNGRIWGSLPLATLSGMDFPARMAELLMTKRAATTPGASFTVPKGLAVSAVDSNYRTNQLAYNPDLLLVWFASVLRARPAPVATPPRRAVFGMLRHLFNAHSDFAASDDPQPMRGLSWRLLRKARSKLLPAARSVSNAHANA